MTKGYISETTKVPVAQRIYSAASAIDRYIIHVQTYMRTKRLHDAQVYALKTQACKVRARAHRAQGTHMIPYQVGREHGSPRRATRSQTVHIMTSKRTWTTLNDRDGPGSKATCSMYSQWFRPPCSLSLSLSFCARVS